MIRLTVGSISSPFSYASTAWEYSPDWNNAWPSRDHALEKLGSMSSALRASAMDSS